MTRIIYNHQIPSDIVDLIEGSEKYVVIISPYIKLWDHLIIQLKSTLKRGVIVKWYYRTNDVKSKIIKELEGIGVEMYNIDNLHSKLYLSERLGIISSMNLYEFSSTTSQEVGLITDERKMLNEFKYYIEEILTNKPIIPKKSILDMGKDFFGNQLKDDEVEEKVETNKSYKSTFKRTQSNGDGYCIRCSTSISYNMKSPYCKKCYKSWNKWKNKDFKEKHCHQCSEDWETTLLKPICLSCFKEDKK